MDEQVPERIVETEATLSLRPANEGAEHWLQRPISCLDHGFVYLVDYMGNDDAIVQAARVSYGAGTKKISENRGLIRYLRRHLHTTPFEMAELKFHCKMPIFVARQWIRHRTANVNEYSGRYSEMLDEFYIPDVSTLRKQSQSNRQGRDEELSPEQASRVLELLKADYTASYGHYREFLEMDLARELARINLSVANYTQWYWKIDLHNLFHFLRLRMDSHAQYEIRVFGDAMGKIVRDAFPLAWSAFEDYALNSVSLSGPEVTFIRSHVFPMTEDDVRSLLQEALNNKRETEESIEKLRNLGLIYLQGSA